MTATSPYPLWHDGLYPSGTISKDKFFLKLFLVMLFYYGNRKAINTHSKTPMCIVSPDVYGKQLWYTDNKYKEISRMVEKERH